MSNKREQLIELMQVSYRQQKAYLESLTEDELLQPSDIKDWSPKDVIAHVIHWDAETAGELEDPDQVDKQASGAGVDHINAEIWQKYTTVTWAELKEKLDKVNQDLIANLDKISEEQLTDQERYEWTNGRPLWQRVTFGCFYHPLQHVAELFARRGQQDIANEIQEQTAEMQMTLLESDTWQGTVLYNLGCFYAVTGQDALALEKVGQGIERYPYLKEWAPQDSDLKTLWEKPEFQALLA